MARAWRQVEPVGDALRHVLQRIDPERRLAVFQIWAGEVGELVAARAEPVGFRDGVLSVRVRGATWMQELQFVKQEIRTRLNQRLGAERVRDIYFICGAERPVDRSAVEPPPQPVAPQPPIDLPPLRDARLAEVFARIARAHQRRGRS